MKLTCRELFIQGFKSFDSKQKVSFGSKGFIFLTGSNEEEPELGANGAGKSSIWDALCWVLFGKTARGMRAGNVKNWNGVHKCQVGLEFSLDSDSYTVFRSFQPNKLTLSINGSVPKIVSQEELESVIRFSFDTFLNSVLVSQFSPMFFDLSSVDKSNLMSSTLDLDKWLEYSANAKTAVGTLIHEKSLLDQDCASLVAIITHVKAQDLSESIARWELLQDHKITKLDEALTKAKAESDADVSVMQDKKEIVSVLMYKQESIITDEYISKKEKHKKVTKKIHFAESTLIGIEGEITATKRILKKLENAKDVCPQCKQSITLDHLKEEKRDISKVIFDLYDSTSEEENKIKDLKIKQEKLDTFCTGIDAGLTDVQDELREACFDLKSIQTRCKTNFELMQNIKGDLAHLDHEINPFKDIEQKNRKKLRKSKKELKNIKIKIREVSADIESNTYWIKGFKEVRLFLIDQALMQLETEVNSSLFRLGLKDWHITFASEVETKSKTIKKGFSILIKSPHNNESVPWESWSGGESQRLRLAGTIGLSSLILNRKGLEVNIEIWDEPSTWLSEQGIEDLLDVLFSRSEDLNKQIWIVDHRTLNYGNFSRTVTVVKKESGSVIQEGF